MGTFSAIETFIDIFIRLSLFITHAQYLGRYLFLNFTSSHSFSFIISHTLSLSLSHHQTNTLVSISFLSHRYTSKMFHLLSTVIQSFLFLHKHITLTFYLPFPFLVHPLYAFNSHWTLPNFSFLCLSLSFPYTLPCSHLHSYLFLVSIFLPSSQPVALPPSHHLSPCFCQCQRNKNLKLHLVNILFSEKPSLYCPQERHYIFPSHFSSLFPQRR